MKIGSYFHVPLVACSMYGTRVPHVLWYANGRECSSTGTRVHVHGRVHVYSSIEIFTRVRIQYSILYTHGHVYTCTGVHICVHVYRYVHVYPIEWTSRRPSNTRVHVSLVLKYYCNSSRTFLGIRPPSVTQKMSYG